MILGPEHDEVAELLGAYALEAVDADEARRVEHHLAGCPRCRAEADQLRQVAAVLGTQAGLEGDEPPARVWEQIVANIGTAAPESAPRQSSTGATEPTTVTPIRHAHRRRPGRRRTVAAAVAAAAVAAIAVLAVGLVHANGQVHQLQSALAGRATDAAVRAALAAPDHQVVHLRTQAGADVAQLVVERSGVGYVVNSTMSTLPSDETYQLWASIDGRAISLGLLGPRPFRGGAFNLGSAVAAAYELMVTVEPAGGVVAPNRTPVATALLRLA